MRTGGRTAFLTIELALGLDEPTRRRARAAAPRATWSRRPYPDLLSSAGFRDVWDEDVTAAYASTLAAWLTTSTAHIEALAELDGAAAVDERLATWRDAAAAVERGWLRRSLYVARR